MAKKKAAKKAGRPPIGDTRATKRVGPIAFTDADYDRLSESAERAGVRKLSTHVRALVLQKLREEGF
jgi:hypothetical protein